MTASLAIHLEAAPLALSRPPPGEASALGMSWFVSADYTAADIADPAVRDAFETLLTPWRWTDLQFETVNAVLGPRLAPPVPPALGALTARLEALRDTLLGQPPLFALGDPEGSEAEPHWPLVLLQLSRIDPGLAHALNLARLFEAQFPDPTLISGASIKAFKVGELTVDFPSPNASATVALGGAPVDIAITQDIQNVWSVDAIRQPGRLLDGYARCVAEGGETRRDWFSGLAASLGRAISPLLRLADLLEHPGVGHPSPLAWRALKVLIDAVVERASGRASALALLFGDIPATDLQPWEGSIHDAAAEIANTLAGELLGPEPAPDALRNTVQSEAFGAAVARELSARAPDSLKAIAQQVLGDSRNVAALLDTLATTAIARRELAPLLAGAAGNDLRADTQPLLDAFAPAFRDALVKLLGLDPAANAAAEAVAEAQTRMLKTELAGQDGLDAVQESGIAFRIDTVFKTLTGGEPDIHETLDGALIAIRRSKDGLGKAVQTAEEVADWQPFEMVSRGKVELELAGGPAPQPPVDLGLLNTPVPAGLVDDYAEAGSTTKVQQAIARFFGEVLTPLSDCNVPNAAPPDPAALQVRYRADALDLDLAYGRAFHVEVGYQSLAGALPAGWCDPGAPFAFDRDRLASTDGVTRKRVALLRTRPPGPPELADAPKAGAPLPRLTDSRDRDVRPLWRERIAAWTDADARRRVETAATVYMDVEQASKSRSFFVLPPSLSHPGASRSVADNDRVRDYWLRRDRDFGLAPPPRNPAVPDPDPAVVGPVRGTGVPQGGVLITLLEITREGLKEIEHGHVVFDSQRAIEVRLECEEGAVPKLHAGQATLVELPTGRIFALELRTLVDAQFFIGGDDPRFDCCLKADRFPKVGTPTHYVFGASSLVLECLPGIDHLPSETALWDALRISDQAGTTRCEWVPPAQPEFDYIGRIQTVRQSWSWDGGPLDEALLGALPWGAGEATRPREEHWIDAEQAYFDQRGISGRTEDHNLGSGGQPGVLFETPAMPNRGADYLRVRAAAISRYAPLREHDVALQRGTRHQARSGDAASDIWKAIAIKARRRDPLATPSLAVLAPMFGVVEQSQASAGDWCGYLDHPVYDTVNGGGLAEQLVAEIVVEHLDRHLPSEGPGETVALAIGADPTLSSHGYPYEAAGDHPEPFLAKKDGKEYPGVLDKAWDPGTRTGAMLPAKAVLGQTLEPLSAAPIIGFSLAFFDAAIGSHRLRPDTMIKVRLRQQAIAERVEGDAGLLTSAWSAAHWITTTPNTDYHDLFEPPVYDPVQRALRLKLKAGQAADPRAVRLAVLMTDRAPNTGAPYLVQGLAGVTGAVVTDLHGAEVIRAPASTGPGRARFMTARLDGSDILFPCDAPEPGEHFLRLLEMRTVSLPTPQPPSLDTVLPDGMADAEGRLMAIGPLWQFRVD